MERAVRRVGKNIILSVDYRRKLRDDLHRLQEPIHLQRLLCRAAVDVAVYCDTGDVDSLTAPIVVRVARGQSHQNYPCEKQSHYLFHIVTILEVYRVQRYGDFVDATIAFSRHFIYQTFVISPQRYFSLMMFRMTSSVSTIPGEAILPIFRMVCSADCPLMP